MSLCRSSNQSSEGRVTGQEKCWPGKGEEGATAAIPAAFLGLAGSLRRRLNAGQEEAGRCPGLGIWVKKNLFWCKHSLGESVTLNFPV